MASLERHPLFLSGALPLRVFPPLFNRYEGGMSFGADVDNAIRQIAGTPFRIRTNLAATLFLSRRRTSLGRERARPHHFVVVVRDSCFGSASPPSRRAATQSMKIW